LADADGGELEAGFGQLDGVGATGQVREAFGLEMHLFAPSLFLEPLLVAAVFPGGDILFVDVSNLGTELVEDLGVGESVEEELVELVPGCFGKPGDLADGASDGFFEGGLHRILALPGFSSLD